MTREEQLERIVEIILNRLSSIRADDSVKILSLLHAVQSYMIHVSACKEPAMGFALVSVAARAMLESVNADKALTPYINCPLCQRRLQFGTCEHDLSSEIDSVEYAEPPRIILTTVGTVGKVT